jgi:hypothetical protein
VSFADRLRAWFKGETKRPAPSPSTDRASRTSTRELSDFVASRRGVEAYLEPRTALYSTTLLLVAADGEYLRRPVTDPKQAASFCDKEEIPLYDARKVGYPRRMRDYEAGTPQRSIGLEELPPWPGDDAGSGDLDQAPPEPPPEATLGDGPAARDEPDRRDASADEDPPDDAASGS